MEANRGKRNAGDIAVIAKDDRRYPPSLRHVSDPPDALFVRGDAGLLRREDAIAVVGTRAMTRYGEAVAAGIGASLAGVGAPIVSGLALGVDAAAHESALRAGGSCIAVLAAGVADGDIGPRANFGLAKRILASGGALVSEFPSGTPATKDKFLRRNRIVAGLARATVIVEAAARSGALVTARLALEEGRDVYAVPGPITSAASDGTNGLIANGATPVLSTATLLADLGFARTATRESARLAPDERAVLAALGAGASSPDEIADRTGLEPRRVATALTSLALTDVRARATI